MKGMLGYAMMLASMGAQDVYTLDDPYREFRDITPKCKYTGGVRVNVRTEPKIYRNSICPCGSGKKYKKCCAIK